MEEHPITRRQLLVGASAGTAAALIQRLGLKAEATKSELKENPPIADYLLTAGELNFQYSSRISGNNKGAFLLAYLNGDGLIGWSSTPFARSLKLTDDQKGLEVSQPTPLFENLKSSWPYARDTTCLFDEDKSKYLTLGVLTNTNKSLSCLAAQYFNAEKMEEAVILLEPGTPVRLGLAGLPLPGVAIMLAYYDHRLGPYDPRVSWITITPTGEANKEQLLSDKPLAFPALSYNSDLKSGIISMVGWPSFGLTPHFGSYFAIFDKEGHIGLLRSLTENTRHVCKQPVVSTPTCHFVFGVETYGARAKQIYAYQIDKEGGDIEYVPIDNVDGLVNNAAAVLQGNSIIFSADIQLGANKYGIYLLKWDPQRRTILERTVHDSPDGAEVRPAVATYKQTTVNVFERINSASIEQRLHAIISRAPLKQHLPLIGK